MAVHILLGMNEIPEARTGTDERERALRDLSQHLASGRLTLTEFEERSARAHAATTKAQLAELFTDLPGAEAPEPAPIAPNPLLRLAVLATASVVFAAAAVLVTGNWLWLSVLAAAPAVVVARKYLG
ncbi:uncharacterized protein DUF1707 [Nocardia mexicana]|uniref:Uncharacterized protein DUF1707 n=2 Tax=Nocardia mexicana TaxID=279262 RepID=A0A370HDG4_9NOCA|nr:uncharacterized protein DUF1707 [Nocardia mexicana]